MPGRTGAYLSACLEGAWRQLIPLAEQGLLHPVGIGIIDSGIHEPLDVDIEPGQEPTRHTILKNEFDWDRITIHDMYPSRGPEENWERDNRITHGAGVASVLVAVNNGGNDEFPDGLSVNSSFSGVVTSVPGIDYEVHFYEVGKKTSTPNAVTDFGALLNSLDDIIERQDEIDVVNISLGVQCKPLELLCYLNPFGFPNQTREYHEHFKKAPEVIFVVGAGNIGVDARLTTPATLSTSSIPAPALLATYVSPLAMAAYTAASGLHSPNMITVGAFDSQTNNRWLDEGDSSNYGPAITIAAPGTKVWAVKVSRQLSTTPGYQADDGTSYAAPFVTGVVALLRSIDPDISAVEVIEILGETSTLPTVCTNSDPDLKVTDCPSGDTEMWRVLNADAAIRELLQRRGISITPPPEPSTLSKERSSLEAIYNAAGGPNWINQTNWLSEKPTGEWYGVTTDNTGRVIALDLYYVGMRGPLSPDVGDLTNLQQLSIAQSPGLIGPLPSELGNVVNLQRLYITGGGLEGPIPAELGNLSNLQDLRLYENNLSGQLPAELASLANLQHLYLAGNDFKGCLPRGLTGVPNNDLDTLNLGQCEEGDGPSEQTGPTTVTQQPSTTTTSHSPDRLPKQTLENFMVTIPGNPPKPQQTLQSFADYDARRPTLSSAGNARPWGIWSDWATIWVVDTDDDKIYAYDVNSRRRAANKDLDTLKAEGNTSPTDIWSDGETIWVADTGADLIFAYNAESKARNHAREINVGRDKINTPTGIWSDGTTIWVADDSTDRIYAYGLTTKKRDSSKDFNTLAGAGNGSPYGMWSDGKIMWVSDYADQKIYAYDLSTKTPVPDRDFETLKAGGNTTPTGIWSNGAILLVSDHGGGKLYAYNMPPASGVSVAPPTPVVDTPAFDRNDTGDFTTLSSAGNARPWGIWSDWATIWVVDTDDDKIYAYDVNSRRRAANKDLDTLKAEGNTSPTDIWSDGETIWVADTGAALIFAYNAESKARNHAREINVGRDKINTPTGIWSDGTTIWVADDSTDRIYAYGLTTKKRDSSKDFNTLAGAGNGSPYGMWSDGKTMWVSDYTDQKIYAYDLSTKTPVPDRDFETLKAGGNTTPTGIWSNGAILLVSDHGGGKLYAYNMPPASGVSVAPPTPVVHTPAFDRNDTGDFTTLSSAGNARPWGIWSDWATIWVVDTDDDKIYAYDVNSRRRAANKDLDTLKAEGNTSPTDIWSDGETIWVADTGADLIFAYNAESKARNHAREINVGRDKINTPTGIWSDGTTIWVADDSTDRIYAYGLTTKKRDSSKDFNTLAGAGNGSPYGMWSDGKTMWVSDYTDQKIYAYDLSTKTPVPDRDFETLKAGGNTTPTGIWSNGAILLVSDHGGGKLYAYNMPPASGVSVAPPTPVVDTPAFDRNDTGDFTTLSSAGNARPWGIWSDWATIWVVDTDDDKIYAYDVNSRRRAANKDLDTLKAEGNTSPTDIWSDGETIWVADTGADLIFAYNAESKERNHAREINVGRDKINTPTGIWSDGTTIWVADDSTDRIYAYGLTTKKRDSSKDFNTLAGA